MVAANREKSALQYVAETIEEVTGVPVSEVAPEKALVDDLGIDSLSMVEIAFTLQKEVGGEIPDEELAGVRTVADLVNLLLSDHGG
ncbi:phosphopantetheine-binding protein [Streptomyces sp. NPDC057638]|uniref:phosphopantetheine-binding protein n=1 Tax=Streptomyces sp. NPDC057638 TaxID=3346190 RepID=UPI0036B2E21C